MKKLLILFFIILLGVYLGIAMQQESGYVLLGMSHWRVEMSLWLALLLFILAVIMLYWLIHFIRGIYFIPRRYAKWREQRRQLSLNNPIILLGTKETYLAQQQWEPLRKLLPKLAKTQALNTAALSALSVQVYGQLLQQSASSQKLPDLERQWQSIPHVWRKNPALLAVYVQYLLQLGKSETAEHVLKKALHKHRDSRLLELYTQINSVNSAKQLNRAKMWLKSDPNNPALLLCLGRLSARLRLWGKARSYLEAAIRLEPNPAMYQALGKVLEELGDSQAALNCYRAGLAM